MKYSICSVYLILGAALCASQIPFPVPAFGQDSPRQTKYQTVSPRPGERCLICGMLLTPDDLALMVRGRRVPLKQAMVDSFMHNQEKYFSAQQPRGALFQENFDVAPGVAQGGISLGWFLFGLHILIALLFGGLSGYVAVAKGLPPVRHFFAGLLLSAFGFLYVLTRPAAADKDSIPAGLTKVPVTHAPVSCPHCGSENHPCASRCPACGGELQPALESETARVAK